MLKYGGYYPEEAEKLAQERIELRKLGLYSEADRLRGIARDKYNVEIMDTRDSYILQWWDGK